MSTHIHISGGVVTPATGLKAIGPASLHRKRRSLLVGTGTFALAAAHKLVASDDYFLVGRVGGDPQDPTLDSISFLGWIYDLRSIIVEHCIDELHVAAAIRSGFPELPEIHKVACSLGIPVTVHLELLGAEFGLVSRDAARLSLAYNCHRAHRWHWRLAKRLLDFSVALLLLLVTAPVFAVIALLVKTTSRGPVFFRQSRIGLRRREFMMWKFRTMVENAEQLRHEVHRLNNARGISFKIIRDPRLTPIGGFLRKTSLDELPQFLNVLMGEMSLVGPRPIPLWVADQMQDAKFYRRFHVMPGLTGWWQVEGREQDFEVMAEQDLDYVDNWSFRLDLKILLRTLPAVLKGDGAH